MVSGPPAAVPRWAVTGGGYGLPRSVPPARTCGRGRVGATRYIGTRGHDQPPAGSYAAGDDRARGSAGRCGGAGRGAPTVAAVAAAGAADRLGAGRAAGLGGDSALERPAAPGRAGRRDRPRGGVRDPDRDHARAHPIGPPAGGRAQAARDAPVRARRGRGGRGRGHAHRPASAPVQPENQDGARPGAAHRHAVGPDSAGFGPVPGFPYPAGRPAVHPAHRAAPGRRRAQHLVGQAAAAVDRVPRGRLHRGGLRGPA